jgi:PST family polysaccharide transporter
MDFRKLAVIETITMAIAGAFAIALALIGYGVWSLAWQMIVTTIIGVVLFWFLTDWRPRFQFDKNAVKELLGFSGNLLGFSVFNYWARNIDNLLVGKFIGTAGLGIYSKAYGLMLMPLSQISSTLGRVMFPSLSRSQDDKELTKRIYLKTIGAIALVTMPMMTGLFVIADSFVLALLGPKWKDVIPVLRILCLVGITQSIGTTVGWIYSSQGRTDLMLRWGMVAGTIGIIGFVIGIWIGSIIAVAYSYAIANIVLLYHNFAIPGKLINMTFSEVLRSVFAKLACALLMSTVVYLLAINFPSEWPHWLRLMILVPFGMTFYVGLLHFLKLKAYLEVKQLIGEQWAKL